MEMIFISIVMNLTMMKEIVMYYKEQTKKDSYQMEELESNNTNDLIGSEFIDTSEICPDCHGSGSLVDNICSSCNGKGLI
jgi:DnaJ-class molecular chaperone